MNLRGQVISVIDLRLKLKLGRSEITSETSIIILDMSPHVLGVIVDSVDKVLSLKPSEISPMPIVETTLSPECMLGVARRDGQLILLLDIEKTVNMEELRAIRGAAA
jgi:purine-binding chemotaxis protein CheW